LLTSARWLTFEAAATFRNIFGECYASLARKRGHRAVELAEFWYSVVSPLLNDTKNPLDALLPVFQQRWADILALHENCDHRLHYTCEELRPRLLSAFAAPAPGWIAARYHSPDVMVAAADAEAIRRGDYQLVLGEMHVGTNTLRAALFVAQHPSPREFEKFYDLDLPESRVVLVGPKSWPQLTTRTQTTMINPRDWLLMGTPDSFGVPKSQALNIGSLLIEQTPDGLTVRTRDGRLRFDAIEVFADILSAMVVDLFKPLRPQSHTPRLTFDRLVVSRETWRFTPADASFAFEKTEAERFLAARRWMLAMGMPRFIFYKTPIELKPYYLDFDSTIYVEMFARMIRRTMEHGTPDAIITASEMLPGPDQNWLRDGAGNAYTSELRIVAVDSAGRRGYTQ
jgi:hypothetical protein